MKPDRAIQQQTSGSNGDVGWWTPLVMAYSTDVTSVIHTCVGGAIKSMRKHSKFPTFSEPKVVLTIKGYLKI